MQSQAKWLFYVFLNFFSFLPAAKFICAIEQEVFQVLLKVSHYWKMLARSKINVVDGANYSVYHFTSNLLLCVVFHVSVCNLCKLLLQWHHCRMNKDRNYFLGLNYLYYTQISNEIGLFKVFGPRQRDDDLFFYIHQTSVSKPWSSAHLFQINGSSSAFFQA